MGIVYSSILFIKTRVLYEYIIINYIGKTMNSYQWIFYDR